MRGHVHLVLVLARKRVAALEAHVRMLGGVPLLLVRDDLLDAEAALLAAVAAEARMPATVRDERLALAETVDVDVQEAMELEVQVIVELLTILAGNGLK